MNAALRKKQKIIWRENFVKLMNNAVFGKTMGNVRKHTDLNFSKKEEEEIIWSQNQIIILQIFFLKCY